MSRTSRDRYDASAILLLSAIRSTALLAVLAAPLSAAEKSQDAEMAEVSLFAESVASSGSILKEEARKLRELRALLHKVAAERKQKEAQVAHSDESASPGCNVTKHVGEDGGVLYDIRSVDAPLQYVLGLLARRANISLHIDSRVPQSVAMGECAVVLDRVSLGDAVEIITGMHGLESVIRTTEIRVFLPGRQAFRTRVEYLEDRAAKAYQVALLVSPQNSLVPEAYYRLGKHHFKMSVSGIAFGEFKTVVEQYPKSEYAQKALFMMGRSSVALGDLAGARGTYYAFVDRYPTSPLVVEALVGIAETLIKAGDVERAADVYRKIVQEHPSGKLHVSARLALVRLRLSQKKYKDAISECDLMGSAAFKPHRAQIQYMKGTALQTLRRYKEARAQYRAALDGPDATDMAEACHLGIGECHLAEEAWLDAFEAFKSFRESFPRSPKMAQARLGCAKALQAMSLWERAVREYKQLSGDLPQGEYRTRAKWGWAECERALGGFGKAYMLFDRISSQSADRGLAVSAGMVAAECLRQDGRLATAVEVYQRLAKADGLNAGAKSKLSKALGDCYLQMDRLPDAVAAYEAAAAPDKQTPK